MMFDRLVCPACGGALKLSGNRKHLECRQEGRSFLIAASLPLLFVPVDKLQQAVTGKVKNFYEVNPFPNYDEIDSVGALQLRARQGVFARLLDEQIPFKAKILEAGCGTGQLSNFLAMPHGRQVWGTDMTLASLKLANDFKQRGGLSRVNFLQMNLFKPAFKPDSFDVVICNGVLHHTGDAYGGFQSLLKLVKPGGYIIIGLYNTYGRWWTHIRRWIFRLTGSTFYWLDPQLRSKKFGATRKAVWKADQYDNPHESRHTVGGVLRWFDKNGVEYVNGIPKTQAFEAISDKEKLFEPKPRGTWLDHFIVQLGMLLHGREGGLFIVIGRKK